ncbi:MAG: hypothetical protein HUJ25_05165 [Crocinitomicaceae bacterium]|nr:hypothetical protein [Crocinitomicaceae bacterium]
MPRKSKIIFLSSIIVLLGFLREYLFVNINWIHLTKTIARRNAARDEFNFLLDWTVGEIVILKWVLTIIFVALFTSLTWIIIRLAFGNKLYNKITLLVFGALLVISGILYVPYVLAGYPIELYAVIRTLMGLAQSFMPLMLLAIVFKFLPQVSKNEQEL